jgi:uncharacterized Zn finger protein (UPF0148 family)
MLHSLAYMSDAKKDNSSDGSHFHDAATLLLKGGCLIGESCPDCSGVQIKFKDDTICVNCGKTRSVNYESRTKSGPSGIQQVENESSKPMTDLSKIEKMVINRIGHLMTDLNSQNDLLNETRVADLIETYLRIFKKIRNLDQLKMP